MDVIEDLNFLGKFTKQNFRGEVGFEGIGLGGQG